MELERRSSGVAKATFYPKLIADITAGTTTTPQSTFNPIPQGNDCCRCGN